MGSSQLVLRQKNESAARLAHLDQAGLDHQIVRGIVGAPVLQRPPLVGRVGNDGLPDVLVPGALEV